MPSVPDGSFPSADEAARSLADIEQRRDQMRGSATEARWVYVLSGVVFFALFASPDFLGEAAVAWISPALGVFGLGYVALLNTRRGSALLGRPVRPRRQEIPWRPRLYLLLAVAVVLLAGLALRLLQPDWHLAFPYWRTVIGAVAGASLAIFGPAWQRALLSGAAPGGRTGKSAVNGAR
ncbi:hypothetical protein [Streptomyces daliensis]|uniref:Uncharacterized protein n=1 Tax=Streptomyces daliensis TaxID=299421 RepID=A0A8T4J1Y5_9ACTN|nr:hypothetical protein [Streptomyces daliensis]